MVWLILVYNLDGGKMAITKTKFINYSRCPRYVALDDLKKEKLDSMISIDKYKKEEEFEHIAELLSGMFDDEGNDLIDVKNEHLETMMPYYNKVEILAGELASKYFSGNFKFSKSTYNQESFDAVIDNIRYLCYVDIYNENNDGINIIEVKATTTKKYLNLGSKEQSIFLKDEKGIYRLIEDLGYDIEDYMPVKVYERNKAKLFDRFTSCGHYIYDIAVQRFIIENDMKSHGDKRNVRYYLAVLNSNYVFDGKYKDGEAIYDTINGEDIISYIDVTSITRDLMDKIYLDSQKIKRYIDDLSGSRVALGEYCEYKKTVKCKFCKLCFDVLPKEHSILCYMNNNFGFKDGNTKYDVFDLINDGKVSMLDIPSSMLNREKNRIQRECVVSGEPYINKDKIKDGLKMIRYPLYHLDFETFPCPLPRYKGERPYSQSVFQFSLHIERKEGVCDLEKDHYGYLAADHLDHRLELVKLMCELIPDDGMVLVYNDSFEKTRLKELAYIFPEYKEKLLKIRDNVFDLMNIVKTNSSLYERLGYSKEEARMFNYYHPDMDGSFSIKKVLPLFSNLTYKGMEVGNGVEAMVTYASFPKLLPFDYKHKYTKLTEYCRQDTYAMFAVLDGLRKSVK